MCITLYLAATVTQYLGLIGRIPRARGLALPMSWLAFLLHGYLLYHWIDLAVGQNLTFFNMFSFVIWLVCLWIILGMSWQPLQLQYLCVFVFPLAALSALLAVLFPRYYVLPIGQHPGQLIHILTAAATFSVLCLAVLQTLLLRIQEGLLKRNYAGNILKQLPPLETMERLLFQMIALGFVMLSVVFFSSWYLFNDPFQTPLLTKTILVLVTWAVFAVLLLGRYFFGWRGRKIVYYTLTGFVLLTVVYFSSSLIT